MKQHIDGYLRKHGNDHMESIAERLISFVDYVEHLTSEPPLDLTQPSMIDMGIPEGALDDHDHHTDSASKAVHQCRSEDTIRSGDGTFYPCGVKTKGFDPDNYKLGSKEETK